MPIPRRRSRSVLIAVLAILAGLVVAIATPAAAVPGGGSGVFINEIHYDNASTDVGEFVELAGPAGTDLTGWSVVLYNGAASTLAPYNTISLTGPIADQGGGVGTVLLTLPTNGLQNGAPDGVALVDDTNNVIQFLSYEGSFTAGSGPAAGLTSTDIGVAESGSTAVGQSLQLTGTGSFAGEFTWTGPGAESPGGVNSGQTIIPPGPVEPVLNEFSVNTTGTDVEYLEIFGTPNTDYSAYSVVEIKGVVDPGPEDPGMVVDVFAMGTTDADGIFVANLASNTVENDPITLLLVEDFTGALGDDLDPGDDGTFDATPWISLADSVSIDDGVTYSPTVLNAAFDDATYTGGSAGFAPGGASRFPDGTGDWVRNDFGLAGIVTPGDPEPGEALNTPGAPNALVPTAPVGQPFPFSEGFDTDDCTTNGWQVISVDTDQANAWSCSAAFSNADVNGFGDSAPADEWLISPAFDMEAQSDEILEFRNFTNFTDVGYPQLEVVYSADYGGAGDPTTAIWTALTGITFSPEDSGQFVDSGSIDLSAISGSNVYFAFHYTSSGTTSGSAATWRIDEVEFGFPGTEPLAAKIHDVQGAGPTVAITDEVEVQGIVTSLFTDNDLLDGFFLQEEDADVDGDPSTSEGIFVFCRADCPAAVAVGDLVTVVGEPNEFQGMSQITTAFIGTIMIDSSGNPLPSATSVPMPAVGRTDDEATFESIEGMVVTFPSELFISEYFELPRFGQLVLTVDGRPEQFTDENAPDVTGYAAFLDELAAKRIVLDDDNLDGNDPIEGIGADEPYPYPVPGLSTTNFFRGGDSITDLTGVMHWSREGRDFAFQFAWRVRPIQDESVSYEFTSNNARPTAADDVGGTLTVASFNVLNYFTTIDEPGATCGPSAIGCRGAHSDVELDRQRAKIVNALIELDADVVGLIEIENNATGAQQDLVDGINAVAGPGTYDFVDTGTIGGDAIKVALIYKPATVSPVGAHAILDSSIDPDFIDTKNRPVLVQTFEETASGERFTAAVNHLKSKGSPCDDVGDPDLNDGQANCSGTRTLAATALADFLATDPTGSGDPDFLIMGDLNAYAMEDPITALESAGYTDLVELFGGDGAYSFVFDGQLGYLDHALANPSLLDQVTGTTVWHINADEASALDYNDGIEDPGESSFERKSNALPVYDTTPYRSSDHDPVVIGLDLGGPAPSNVISVSSTSGGTVGGVSFADEDIVSYDQASDTWTMLFDGSDVGLSSKELDAFALLDDGSIVMSFEARADVADVGDVDDSDLVRFVPVSLGDDTAGTFELYFDGSDVGLSTSNEDIDAVTVLGDGRLIISTNGSATVRDAGGAILRTKDEDLLGFTPTSIGSSTGGSFELYFDGSDIGLTKSNEDVWGVSIGPDGDIQLLTKGNFGVDGISGGKSDVFTCGGPTTGDPSACDSFGLLLDGSAAGLGSETVDAIHVTIGGASRN